ncbi:hypothetical protein I593_02177 [Acinetobacter tandoii DSM 14970 = CIP 107469]|uniref:DUF2313 domain-containing protein n=1 Tax=Acinetobacter tandoii DSM 14970 = CIP 107469 TaxID=1120927 RepID=R9AZ67_9GAMM|nr:hypothetical protein I593_02177 [Acinetobacter tandoii DSM 14970 = CIP 107469]
MNLEQTTDLYASILRQLLPVGGYDPSPSTEALSVDVYAHAKLFAQADLDAKRILSVLEAIPQELINEYELEYGLPLKCTVNASRTVEERLQILNWVRTSRNVLNRAYLEQLLAIFGVVLIDIVKFKPLLCTAACDSPVNTEQLRYKVFLRLQYPMNADMSCIVENYLPGYLRIEWMIDMPWGDWILNPGVTVNANGIAHYTAYKTNQREYYDSYANFDLTAAIVRSLHDSDMQQWQAVIDACNELTKVDTWFFDNVNERVIYIFDLNTVSKYLYRSPDNGQYYNATIDAVNAVVCSRWYNQCYIEKETIRNQYLDLDWCGYDISSGMKLCSQIQVESIPNTNYDPNLVENRYISYEAIAQKIISNASSSNEAISLLAETYLEAVANSIFYADESKQFVKPSDLIGQFEPNKTLRI